MFLLLFQYWMGGPRKVNNLPTSPNNQFRDYFIWNRIEKLVPLNWNFAPRTFKAGKQIDQTVFKSWLFAEIWVSKNPGFVPRQPLGVYISRNDPQKTKSGKLQKHQKSALFEKMASFFMPGEPLGRMRGNRSGGLPERIPYKESKNPLRQAWLGKIHTYSSVSSWFDLFPRGSVCQNHWFL